MNGPASSKVREVLPENASLPDELRMQLRVMSAHFDQFFMGALFHDLAAAQHENTMGVADSRKAMCNNEGSAAGEEFFQGMLNHLFSLRIHGTGGFIEK